MKKIILAVVIIAVVAAAGIGAYFATRPDASNDVAVPNAYIDSFAPEVNTIATYVKNPDRYQKYIGEAYEIGDDLAAKFYEIPEEWLAYTITLGIKNTTDEPITVYGIDVADNGKKDVYICTNFGGELGLGAGNESAATVSILTPNGDYEDAKVEEIVRGMDIRIIYGKTVADGEDPGEMLLAPVSDGIK